MTEPPAMSDPRALRAVAHPTRSRILAELSASGPARAADLARDLGIPANQASFHLRQLAKYGLVEEAPEEARDRRDRVWRVTAQHGYTVNLKAMRESAGGKAAADVYVDHMEAWATYLLQRALRGAGEATAGAEDRRSINDSAIRLTAEERSEFTAELDDLINRWNDRTRDRSVPRRTYSFFSIFQPYPPLESQPAGTDDTVTSSDTDAEPSGGSDS
jgi:DNA-binding transcriptional ArsR family regulator